MKTYLFKVTETTEEREVISYVSVKANNVSEAKLLAYRHIHWPECDVMLYEEVPDNSQ